MHKQGPLTKQHYLIYVPAVFFCVQVVGVSFHVGSGCQNVGVYADAIAAAREAFDIAASYGFNIELLDIGG
jgi:diaminopimelate decarboxylase